MNPMPISRTLSLLCAIGTLAGCSTPYLAPQGVPTADVRFVSETDDTTFFSTIDPAKCPGVPKSLTLGLTGRDRGRIAGEEPELFMPGSTSYKREHVLERKIEAGKSFAVLAQGNVVYYPQHTICPIGVSFVPEALAQYEVTFRWAKGMTRCSVSVTKLDANGALPSASSAMVPTKSLNPWDTRTACPGTNAN